VGLLDAGMLFYVYLFAMNQTRSRQQAWFISFVMWLGFEIFLSSTALVLVFHLLIPLYVWSDVTEAKKRVLKDLMTFREEYLTNDGSDGSNALANDLEAVFPELPESQLVLQFSTSMPKKKFGKEYHIMDTLETRIEKGCSDIKDTHDWVVKGGSR
jgi:hypothetical protein